MTASARDNRVVPEEAPGVSHSATGTDGIRSPFEFGNGPDAAKTFATSRVLLRLSRVMQRPGRAQAQQEVLFASH
jgi:hypothetical protein